MKTISEATVNVVLHEASGRMALDFESKQPHLKLGLETMCMVLSKQPQYSALRPEVLAGLMEAGAALALEAIDMEQGESRL